MDTKNPISQMIAIVAIVLLLGVTGVFAYRNLAPNNTAVGPAGGATTVAPVVQRYPDGSIVPYPAAPTGAIPGDPASIRRTVARNCPCCGQPIASGAALSIPNTVPR